MFSKDHLDTKMKTSSQQWSMVGEASWDGAGRRSMAKNMAEMKDNDLRLRSLFIFATLVKIIP